MLASTIKPSTHSISGLRLKAAPANTLSAPTSRRLTPTTKALADTNIAVNLISSAACGAAAVALQTVTAPDRDGEIARIQTADGAIPIAAGIAADLITHSIPGLNILFNLAAEPAGAAASVAYITMILLSSPSVDPNTLAPKGSALAAETAKDARSAVRVPYSQVVKTALNVIDFENKASTGAGWEVGKDGLPKLPINSVLFVIGTGVLILELASHSSVLSFFMPRILSVTGWLAVAGYFLDKRE